MRKLHEILCFVLSLLMISCLYTATAVDSHYGNFNLEAEQHWETYGVGGTCIAGTHNLFVADVDGDGVLEMVTGGFMYKMVEDSRTVNQAPFKVWSWDGQRVTLEASDHWNGNIGCLFAADVDGDNAVELITAGNVRNDTGYFSSFRIWHCGNEGLVLKAEYKGASISSIFVSDLDSDGVQEIVTVGRLHKESVNTSQLCLWHFKDNNLLLVDRLDLDVAAVTSANSVYACDLNGDGGVEIVTAGYSDNLNNSKGQLCVWQWNRQEFSLKANETWQLTGGSAKTIAGGTQGNTAVNNVKAGDLDGDGYKEIVTGGFAYDGEKVNAQTKIWRWDGNVLTEKASQEWATDYLTEVKCISLNDVDGDGQMDIVQSGITAAQGSFKNSEVIHDRGQLRVWSWDGTTLTLKQGKDWTFDDGACAWNVANGDVDKDGVTEIITVGCTALGGLCDPDMRIWSLPSVNAFPSYLPYAFAGVLLATGVFSMIYFLIIKRKNLLNRS